MELKDRLNEIILTVQINHKSLKMVDVATNRIIEIVEEEIRKASQQSNAADEFILDGTTPCPECGFTEKHLASCKYRR